MILDEQFEPYLRNRLICKRSEEYYVIIPNDVPKPIPINCPVCDFLFRSKDDETSWYKFQCCERCSTFWAIPRKNDWMKGWRPNKDELEKEISIRPPINVDINIELFIHT